MRLHRCTLRVALLAAMLTPASAAAEPPRVHATAGVAHAVSEPQSRELGFGIAGDVGLEVPVAPAFGIMGKIGGVVLADGKAPSDPRLADRPAGLATTVFGGFRLAQPEGGPFVDLGLGLVATGVARFGFDAHVGWDFAVGRSGYWQAGPSIGYLHVVQPDDTLRPEDARLFTVGAHVAWGQRSGTCGDQDGDGICDARDACPGVAGPASGNEAMHGCPRSDRDRDSIYDDEDACPDESGPRSADPKKNGCPRADRDGDAVYDDEDACPEEPGVRTHNPKTNGCPPSDRDSDGVFDDEDACPDAAGVRTTDKATNGCAPLTSTIRLVGDRLVLDDRIHFDTDSPRVRSKSFPLLRRVAEFLNASPDILHVDIEGHADRVGADDYNLGLSRARAASVRTLLIGAGVSESRLSARGYGESRPKTKVDTGRGSVEDRRVEFWVVRSSPRTESVGEKP